MRTSENQFATASGDLISRAFADAVLQLMANRAQRLELGRAGREMVERRYRWDSVVDRLEEFHARLVAMHSAGAR